MDHHRHRLVPALLAPVLALGLTGCGEATPSSHTPTPSPTPTAAPTPAPTPAPTGVQPPSSGPARPADAVRLDTGLPDGPPPRIAYMEGRTLHLPDGGTRTMPHAYDQVALVGDLVAGSWSGGDHPVVELTQDGVTQQRRRSGGLVESPTGQTIAWDQPDGTLQTARDGGSVDIARGLENASVTAVVGAGTCYEAESPTGGCVVFYSPGGGPARLTSSHGIDDEVGGGVLHVSDASSSGDLAVETSSSDEGSCWGVLRQSRRLRWEACDHSLFQFGPDGQLLLAGPPYLDGPGFGRIAMLDSATGVEVAAYAVENGYIAGWAWEDETTALLIVHLDGDGWRVVRVGADGTAETSLVWPGEDRGERPWTLAMRPS